jgi:redox-sensitive bicupin YhaK (pirin superfamily)
MLDIQLRAGETLPVTLPATYNALAVVSKGRVTAEEPGARSAEGSESWGARRGKKEKSAGAGELLLFANDGERLDLTATEDAHVILLSGEPIDEPIVQYGPFVMNSIDEIKQAIFDVETGAFGPVPTQ